MFRYPDLRYLWLSTLLSAPGYMGEMVVLGWLLLKLTDSPLVVSFGLGIRFAPALVSGVLGGALADRIDRRQLLVITSLGMAVAGASLGVLVLVGWIEVWQLLAITFIGGGMKTLQQVARQSFTFDVVGPSEVVGGLAFINLGQRIGGGLGALALGYVVGTFGVDVAYLTLAVCDVISVVPLLFIRSRGQAAPISRQPVWQNLKEFAVEIRRNKPLLTVFLLVAAVEMLGFPYMTILPSLARDVLKVGAGGLGVLTSVLSAGGLFALVLVSVLGETKRKGLSWLIAVGALGLSLVFLGVSSTFALALLAMALVSGMAALSDVFSQSLMQMAVPNELRGRAMGAWSMAIGTMPLGAVAIGGLATAIGVSPAVVISGLAAAALAVGSFVLLPDLRRS